MKKRILTILMALALMLSLLPAGALAADELAPDTGEGGESTAPGAEEISVSTWGELVRAIAGDSTNITLQADLTRGANDNDDDKDIVINRELTIDLLGWTLDGNGEGSVIKAEENGNLTIEDGSEDRDGKITGGKATNGGGIHVNGGALTMEGGTISGNNFIEGENPNSTANGGSVYVSGGTFNMYGGEISGNMAASGGGVYLTNDATFTMTGTEEQPTKIEENTSLQSGGGVFIEAYRSGTVTVTMDEHVVVSKNVAETTGGGVYNAGGNLTIAAAVDSNEAKQAGGGIFNDSAGIIDFSATVTNNEAPEAGGVAVISGTFTMNGGSISNNTADIAGGVENLGAFEMNGGEIHGNTAATGANDFYNLGNANGTFTLRPAEDFGYSGWFVDEPDNRYTAPGSTDEYEVIADDSSLKFLTLGEDKEEDEPDVPDVPVIVPPVVDDEPDDVVPPMLNGDDHFAYVIGYEDGTVRPDGSITRAEVATIIFRLLDGEVRDGNLTTVNDFTDVNEGDWYNTAISTLVKLGIIDGRTATTFDPNAPITRAEFATLFARFDESGIEPDSDFKDIATHWAREYIERAAALGWINGYEDGTVKPDSEITRAEAMTMINRVLNREPADEGDLLPDMRVWSDNKPGTWYYIAVQEATNSHKYTRPDAREDWTEIAADPDWTQYQ